MFYNHNHKDLYFTNLRTDSRSNKFEYRTLCADVLELDEQFILELALPGVNLDDIELKVEGNILTVWARRMPTMFEERATYITRELPTTYMVREFEFHTEILVANIEARLERGLLYISVPKAEIAHRIPVSVGMLEGHYNNNLKTRVGKEHRAHKEITIK